MEESVLPPPVGTVSEKMDGGSFDFAIHCFNISALSSFMMVFLDPAVFSAIYLMNNGCSGHL